MQGSDVIYRLHRISVHLYIRSKDRGSADIHAPAKINAMGKFVSGHGDLRRMHQHIHTYTQDDA